ncbi:hypothetical protein BU16DRAFT_567374 [Lophium mytilinum]|uniref:F-box domain-containing protein n=1 Tax=Lophium mytilinum TaxID=390894 RepID=A0A6A6QA28_9PEZI|nr:hypothetical protein BU16DRAFT_567374 [Lophium mytilinum]
MKSSASVLLALNKELRSLPAPPPPTLVTLPIELLVEIAQYLQDDFEDLRNLRRGSRSLAEAGAMVLFKELHLALYPGSIQRFTKIAFQRSLAPLVRKVVFHGQVPPSYVAMKGWRIALERVGVQVPRGTQEKSFEIYRSYADANRKLFMINQGMFDGIEPAELKIYQNFDLAIARLAGLQEVVLTAYDEADDHSPFWNKVKEEIFLTPATWRRGFLGELGDSETTEGQMLSTIRWDATMVYPGLIGGRTEGAILLTSFFRSVDTSTTSLRGLQLTTAGGEFWCQRVNENSRPQGPPLIPKLYGVFATLTKLDLQVWKGDRCATQIADCISACTVLRELNLHAKLAHRVINDTVQDTWPHKDILASVKPWPRLRKLGLEIDASQSSLLECFKELSGSLERLRLHNVRLLPTATREDWKTLCDRNLPVRPAQNVGCWAATIQQLSCILSLREVELSNLGEISVSNPAATVFRVFTSPMYIQYVNKYVLERKGNTDWFNADQESFLDSFLGTPAIAQEAENDQPMDIEGAESSNEGQG